MPSNTSVPPIECLIRAEFLHNLESEHGSFERVQVLGVRSIRGSAVLFTVLTERGAMFANMPLHALVTREDAPRHPLHVLELWDAFAYDVECFRYAFVKGCRGSIRCGDGAWRDGSYLWTLDWNGGDRDRDVSLSEVPQEHKTAHMFALDDGCFALMPNNRVLWREASFVTDPIQNDERVTYKVNRQAWSVEGDWRTEHTSAYFYSVDGDKEADPDGPDAGRADEA